jgi:predicted neuraminidase
MMPSLPSAERGTGALPLAARSRVVLILATLIAAGVAAYRTPGGGRFAASHLEPVPHAAGPVASIEAVPHFSESWISPAGHTISAHSCSTCVLPNGDLMAVWFGGTREGAADVALFTARYERQKAAWTVPRIAVDRLTAQAELGRLIKKVGNAVIFPDRNGTLWLVYVTVTVGGWSGSALNVKSSQDEGLTWTASRRLYANPILNLSSLVRNKPVYADDGRIGLPVYHEMALTYPQMLWLAPGPDGKVEDYVVRSAPQAKGLIQPSVVPLENNRVVTLLRDHTAERRLRTVVSDDNGWTWSTPATGSLPNSDSAVDALRLRDGRILLVYNDAADGRENLRLATSADEGRSWVLGPMIEQETAKEFSYPCLIHDLQGRFHLTYTWKRQRIKHVEFNLAWLDQVMLRSLEQP